MLQKVTGKVMVPGTTWTTSLPQMVLVSVIYFLVARLSLNLALYPGNASPVWPCSAIALCAILARGKRMAPSVWIGAALANAPTHVSLVAAAIMGMGNTLEALTAAALIQRLIQDRPYFSRGENIFKFIAIAAGSSLIAATIGTLCLRLPDYIPHAHFFQNWMTWWLGDTTGMIIFTPLISTWAQFNFRREQRLRLLEIAIFGILLASATYVVFNADAKQWATPYLLLIFTFWAAFRYSLAGVARTIAIIAAVATWQTAQGVGPFSAHNTVNESLISLQLFLCMIWAVGIVQVALLEQRTRAEKKLRDERDGLEVRVKERTAALERHVREILRLEKAVIKRDHQLAEAQGLAHLASWEWDVAANVVTWSDEMYRIFEIKKSEFQATLEGYASMIHPDDREMAQKIIDDARRTRSPYKFLHRVVTPKGTIKNLMARGFAVTDKNGIVSRMFGTAQDVTELKVMEHLWLEAEERYREVVELSPHAIFIIDSSNRCDFANAGAISMCGAQFKNELIGQSVTKFLHPLFHQEFLEKTHQFHPPGKNAQFEAIVIKLDGTAIDVEVTATHFMRDINPASLVMMQDITERKRAERKFKGLLESAPDAMVIVNPLGDIVLVNSQTEKLFGYPREEIIGKKIETLMPDRFRARHDSHRAHYFSHPQARPMGADLELWGRRKDGTEFPVTIALSPFETDEGVLISSVVRDMTANKAIEQSLRLAAQVFESSREAIVILDQNRKIVQVNKAFGDITGYTAQQIVDDHGNIIRTGLHDSAFYDRIWHDVEKTDHWEGESLCQRRNNQSYMARVTLTAVRNSFGTITNYILIFSDISERKEAESRIRFMAEHDFLTRLPSRAVLLDRLGQAISTAKRNRTQLALLFIDLDRFKTINDTMGHIVGDKLLQHVAHQLKNCVRRVDTICRQGGDEFIIMLSEIRSAEQVAHVADGIMKAIALPYQVDNHEINITSSIGISMYPNDGDDIDTLIKNADVAMYHAKESGRNSAQFFNGMMNERIVERLALEESLRRAIDRNEFVLQYQPQTDVISGHTVGAEALIRWQHPELGLLSPIHFISVAEDSGLIIPIGNWVLRTACRQAKVWFDTGNPLVVSVNISVAQFRHKDLIENVADALKLANLPPQYLELEVTESILAEDSGNAVGTLMALKKTGVKLAIDDFGTGYSSLSGLNRFTVDKLKIDQSFVRDIMVDDEDAALTSAIISMAKNLKLKVVAEGVETQGQMRFLASHGCDEAQGFYLSKALSPDDFTAFRVLH